jgi:hypothetical protein
MRKNSSYLYLLTLGVFIIQGCSDNYKAKKASPSQEANAHADSSLKSDSSISLRKLHDKLMLPDSTIGFDSTEKKHFIRIAGSRIPLSDDVQVDSNNIFGGIYELKSDSLIKHAALMVGHYLFVTTYADLGRGYQVYLQAIDTTHKRSIIDPAFKRNFLYSDAGIFLIQNSRIFLVDLSFESTVKKSQVSIGSLFKIDGRYFANIKDVYREGEQIFGDTSKLAWFFKAADSSVSTSVHILPKRWWKRKVPYF